MTKNIMIIDDDKLVLGTLKRLLQGEGYNITAVMSGYEALEKIKDESFDLIISDIKMAGMDGVQVATAIKKYCCERKTPEIPIVFITGYADIANQKHAQNLGEVLIKPFDNKELLENVKIETEILPHKEIRRQVQAEKRLSPRITTNFPIRLFPDVEANVIDISETGICFDCKGHVLPEDILLLMDLSPLKSKQSTKFSAKVVWHKALPENRFQIGTHFSLLDKNHFSQIRDFIFDSFAKKASAGIKDDGLKIKVEDFFNKNIRQYHESLSTLSQESGEGKIESGEIEKKLTNLTNELLVKGDALGKILDSNIQIKKMKQVFRELVGCWYYKSPILKMAYDKPRGYPGDFELFETIYNKKPLAEEKSFGFYWDNYFLNNEYAKAARARKNKMKNILQDLIENSDLNTLKFLNIACGPSREIRELLCDPHLSLRRNLIFTGLDNDKDALKFSQAKLNNLPPNIKLRLLNENVLNIFRDSKYYDIIGKQDVIYILGLTEYLPDRIFKKLIFFLFKLLNDKGMLVITYKDEAITFPSLPPEWLCDWAFIKRAKDDLISSVKEIGSDKCSIKIEKEGTGTIFFLTLTKS